MDSILSLNESVDFLKREKLKELVFKVDFEKAYDSILWDYLENMMKGVCFHWKWRKWIRGCISLASISILVNGSPPDEFSLKKGIRQGDPLSPFLFLIVAEGLSCLMRKAEAVQILEGVEIGKDNVRMSHLQFADDTVLLGKALMKNAKAMKGILRLSKIASKLKVNFHKSSLHGINIPFPHVEVFASLISCMIGGLPFTYLGLPIGATSEKMKYGSQWWIEFEENCLVER